ncbi:MAG: glycerate kinase type-2 family protein [Acidimicrobiia bacterium]
MDTDRARAAIRRLLDAALAAVDPERLTSNALAGTGDGAVTLIAIGKAAPGMCRGAARAVSVVEGLCVTIATAPVPPGVELLLGDHPIPGEASFEAGRRVLETARTARGRTIALISGGGSALCEHPIEGLSESFLRIVHRTLVRGGASIAETNLVRRHLSAIKGGGLAAAAPVPIETYAISDVCGADPSVIASGPTVPQEPDLESALGVMSDHGIEVPPDALAAMRRAAQQPLAHLEPVTSLADGHTALEALADTARGDGVETRITVGWIHGPLETALDRFLSDAGSGLTVASGEPEVTVTGEGTGGRNTHAALLAATRLVGGDAVFAAFATDGSDGASGSAGAIVDGTTVQRGGDASSALAGCNSAPYLARTGDLVITGPTGTNVSDLWLLWRP